MVSRSLIAALLGSILVVTARAELNLSPKLVDFKGDGVTFHRLVFSDGTSKEITYQQPVGWEYSGTATRLTLHPPNEALAEGKITRVSSSQTQGFDDQGTKQLIQQTLAAIPEGSTDLKLVSQEQNPVKIGGKETFLVVVSYIFYGIRYDRSMMFMNRGSEQIIFQFTSYASDFNDLQRAFLASQFSWQNL